MGYAAYEGGGLLMVLGGFVILVGLGLAGYLIFLSRAYWLFGLAVLLIFLILGAVMVSRGGYTRKQNTPIGRVEDFRSS